MSYAVIWSEGGGPTLAGSLELTSRYVALAGGARPARESSRKLFYDDLADIRIERRPERRLIGRPTLVVERQNGVQLLVASLFGGGTVNEIAERISAALASVAA